MSALTTPGGIFLVVRHYLKVVGRSTPNPYRDYFETLVSVTLSISASLPADLCLHSLPLLGDKRMQKILGSVAQIYFYQSAHSPPLLPPGTIAVPYPGRNQVRRRKKILVHCRHGCSTSAAVLAVYRLLKHGVGVRNTLSAIADARGDAMDLSPSMAAGLFQLQVCAYVCKRCRSSVCCSSFGFVLLLCATTLNTEAGRASWPHAHPTSILQLVCGPMCESKQA